MKKIYLAILILLGIVNLYAQDYYLIQLNKKENTEEYYSNPLKMLSQESLDRRIKYGIQLDEKDIPISNERLNQIKKINLVYNGHSKWLNSLLVSIDDISAIDELKKLSFVSEVKSLVRNESADKILQESSQDKRVVNKDIVYGESDNFIKKIKLDVIHSKGFKGKSMHIGVIDGGFLGADTITPFKHIFKEKRIKDVYNFVAKTKNVYQQHEHGTTVLSTMAVNLNGEYVGAAPEANYSLYVTEDTSEETLKEWMYWVQAAERADSIGVDVINSSLGYDDFDDARYNYSIDDLDGTTAFISEGAKIATSRGIMLVVSAGNYALQKWKKIGFPSDPEEVFTIGNILNTNVGSGTTSYGPNANGSIKPDVSALGVSIKTIGSQGTYKLSSGTSFSSPTIAGAMASLMSAFPKVLLETLKQIVRESGHLFPSHKNNIGYGYPDFSKVYDVLSTLSTKEINPITFKIYPNPVTSTVKIYTKNIITSIEIINLNGQLIKGKQNSKEIDISELSNGVYLIRVVYLDGKSEISKVIKK